VGYSQSHHLCAPKCQAQQDACRPNDRADQGFSFSSRRALQDCCTARCCKRSEGRRVAWSQMGRRRLRGFRRNVSRSVVKQKITRCKTEASRKPIPLDAELAEVLLNWKLQAPYPQPGDWVFASPHKKGKQPYWPGSLFRAHLKPALEAAGDSGQCGLAYAAAHVRHFDESEWRGHQDDSGVVTPFELQSDRRHVHASRHSDEARSANKARQNDSRAEQAGRGKAGVRRVSFFYRTLSNPRRKGPIPINHLFYWRPRRDLNPCYRRESRPRVRNRLKLNGTDSALGPLSDCGDGLSDC